ncbi:MAG: argininosuccinate lyase [Candidatus Omnitrophica bacterium]|nr:argininosuccinate lyase [Candidatus Omnitrophota bacterium]
MAKKLWGTRFPKKTSTLTDAFTSSIAFDKRLASYDIIGSIAHAKMLGECAIISKKDAASLTQGLQALLKDIEKKKFSVDMRAEDIHSYVQEALFKKVGSVADKLHTARSRNDQVALDVRMYLLDQIDEIVESLGLLQKSILKFARNNIEVIIPGYTHLQMAQCVLLAHHLLSYIESLARDTQRLNDARKRVDLMPLGACAFSGTGLPIDREKVRRALGFSAVTENSIDSVSDRDFIIEVLADISILSVHLSRIAEDLILWSTREFNFIDIDYSFCTGSSIMPHKKNPDVLELIRGSVGKIHGALSSVLILLKGLPSSYNRDLQLDKPPLFEAVDSIKGILEIATQIFESVVIEKQAIAARLDDEALFSVDIVEYLIEKGVSYRQAHDVVGRLVRDCLDKGKKISALSIPELKRYSPVFEVEALKMFNAQVSVNRKKSYGGTSPQRVRQQLARWEKKLNA